jgi:UDP-N-acetylmuramyl pentapeptide phosphotransferase/UDP-N-acetylglucosamine-1-phosphate transferase
LIICFSAFLYLFFDGAVFSGAGFESVDTHWLFVALAPFLTALCLVALINAINFIDGVNGLASGHLILTLSAIGLVTLAENGSERLPLILTLIGALVGLFLINFPFGKIFLGDTGAYVFGMMVGILLIDLEVQNDVVSIWTLLLFVAWPAADLIQTILRRVSSRKKAYNADMMHMHHIILRSLKMRLKTKHAGKSLLNPLTSIIILLVAGLPILVGVGFYSNVYLSFVFCIVFFLSFFGGYVTIVRLATNRNHR